MIADKAAAEAVGSDAGHSVLDGFISEQEYARQRGVSLRTCQRERALRKSAPYVLLGKKVFYRVATVRAWLLAQERTFEEQASYHRSQVRLDKTKFPDVSGAHVRGGRRAKADR
jgi:hypothetical protein